MEHYFIQTGGMGVLFGQVNVMENPVVFFCMLIIAL